MGTAARYLRPDVIAKVQRLDLRARFIVEGFVSGLHSSPFHGFSVEFSEHRKYAPGDDLRLIDWSVLARTDRYYVKKYEAETNLECHLLVDTSASMAYPEPEQVATVSDERERRSKTGATSMSKLDYAICLAAALGHLMIHQQDSVGLAICDSKLRSFIPARSKRTHLMQLIGELARVRAAPDQTQKGLAAALHALAGRIHTRGLIVVLSDFLADVDAVLKGLHHLRFRGHDLILFQVLDWTEVAFPFEDLTRFHDPETDRELTSDPKAVRSGYLEALRAFTERYRREAAAMRADFVQVDTSMTFDRALIEFLLDRQRRF